MTSNRSPETLEGAAEEFERLLVRNFVDEMTDGLFENSLAGDDGPSWMESQRSSHRDVMNDVLSSHLVESDSLSIADRLIEQWEHAVPDPDGTDDDVSDEAMPPPPSTESPQEWLERPTHFDLSSP